ASVWASVGWRRTIVRHTGQARWIVDGRQVRRLIVPTAPPSRQIFAFGLKRFHPLLLDSGFIETLLKRSIGVVILGHRRNFRRFEELLDLLVSQLAHQAGKHTSTFFTDGRIAQTVGR